MPAAAPETIATLPVKSAAMRFSIHLCDAERRSATTHGSWCLPQSKRCAITFAVAVLL
jgi:hypothetical protein